MPVLLFSALLLTSPQDAEPPALVTPPGFAHDLVAEAPTVGTPTSVYCLEDGSLLIGEEAGTEPPAGRIRRLSFELDGPRTDVFADGLHPVLAMEQIDGQVYVLNTPHLTRLSDPDGDGRFLQRDVILDKLGPEPEDGRGLGAHAVGGFELGMDGFLYLSVGELGLRLVTGRDGSTLSLRGSGVIRVRPDGTRLEVVATGTRDHTDLVLDERGDVFVHDGGHLTHVIEGGFYGHPWTSSGHPERALPTMGEFGGGLAGGGIVYTDRRWPRHYGHFFWCLPDERVVRDYELEPSGATYRVFGHEDLVAPGTATSFEPVDLCVSADARCIYIADRAEPASGDASGRIWRVRLADDEPERSWHMPALPLDQGALVDALADFSFRRRLRAQRAVAELGANGPLIELLVATVTENRNEQKRRHALWALAALDGDAAREAALASLQSTENMQAQALRAFAQHSRRPSEELIPILNRGTPRARREAAAALGRVGHKVQAVRLATAHDREDDPFVRWSIRSALARIGVWDTEVVHWVHLTSDPQAALLQSMRGVYDLEAVERLAAVVAADDETLPAGQVARLGSQRARALEVLSDLHRRHPHWQGRGWEGRPAERPAPPKTVDWEGTDVIVAAVRRALADADAAVRAAALTAVGTMPDPGAPPLLFERYEEEPLESLRLAILGVLAELRDQDALGLLASILRDDGASRALHSAALRAVAAVGTDEAHALLLEAAVLPGANSAMQAECLRTLGELEVAAAAGLLEEHLASPRGKLRAIAARALAQVEGAGAVGRLSPLLGDRSIEVRRDVVDALVAFCGRDAVPVLMEHRDDAQLSDIRPALANLADARALDSYLEGLERPDMRVLSRAVLQRLSDEVRPELERRLLAGELDAAVVEELSALWLEPTPLFEWHVFGPYRHANLPVARGGSVRFDSEGVALAAALELGAVEPSRAVAADSGAWLYAVASYTPVEPGVLELAVDSDGEMDLWVAGRHVYSFRGRRVLGAAPESVVVKFGDGAHEIAVRVRAEGRFRVAVPGRGGGPSYDDLEVGASSPELDVYRAFAEESPGDSSRGFQLFRDPRLGCVRCHTLATPRGRLGDRVGPDLDGVAGRHDRAGLIEALLEPQREVAAAYRAQTLELVDDTVVLGQVTAEDEERVFLVDETGTPVEVALGDIAERKTSRRSVMPAGLHQRVSLEEFADLLAFMGTLGGGGGDGAERRR
jgi:putative heme-binding domain-containing protein